MLIYLAFILILATPASGAARWIEDIAVIDNPTTGPIEFSHYSHLEAVGNDCVICHNRIFHINTSKNQPVSMAEMRQRKSCGMCHNGSKAFATTEDCASCHPTHDISFKTEAGDAHFSHAIHTEIYGCGDCHPDLFIPKSGSNNSVSMEQMSNGVSCGACHDGDTAFATDGDCETCHAM